MWILFGGTGSSWAADPEGRWKLIAGSGPGVGDYQGHLYIEKRGRSYVLEWETSTGGFQGVGLSYGRKLVVGWGTGRGYGLGVFHKKGDDWVGHWVDPASVGLQGRERWSPAGDGAWSVDGRLPGGGGAYVGEVTLDRTSEVIRVRWTTLGEVYEGIGLQHRDRLVVVWGSPEAAGFAEYRLGRRRGRGRWMRLDGTGWGSERLRRIE